MENLQNRDTSPRLGKYIGVFTITYVAALILVQCVAQFSHLPSGANAGVLVASVYISVNSFVKDWRRTPDRPERRGLSWGCLFASYVASLIVAFGVFTLNGESFITFLAELNEKMMPVLLGVAFIIVSLLYYIIIGICFSIFGKIAARNT